MISHLVGMGLASVLASVHQGNRKGRPYLIFLFIS